MLDDNAVQAKVVLQLLGRAGAYPRADLTAALRASPSSASPLRWTASPALESVRIKRERKDTEAIVGRLSMRHDQLEDAMRLVLDVFSRDLHDLYLRANGTQRRFINQALFQAMWVHHEDIERSELNSPFEEARVVAEAARIVENAAGRLERETEGRAEAGLGVLPTHLLNTADGCPAACG